MVNGRKQAVALVTASAAPRKDWDRVFSVRMLSRSITCQTVRIKATQRSSLYLRGDCEFAGRHKLWQAACPSMRPRVGKSRPASRLWVAKHYASHYPLWHYQHTWYKKIPYRSASVSNLFFVGDCVEPQWSMTVDAAASTGMFTGKAILRLEGR